MSDEFNLDQFLKTEGANLYTPPKEPSLLGAAVRDMGRSALGPFGAFAGGEPETQLGQLNRDIWRGVMGGPVGAVQAIADGATRVGNLVGDAAENNAEYTSFEWLADHAAKLYVEWTTGQEIDPEVFRETQRAWIEMSPEERERFRDEHRGEAFDWFDANVLSREARPEFLRSETVVGGIVESLTQYLTPGSALGKTAPVSKALAVFAKAGKTSRGARFGDWLARNVVLGTGVGFVAFQGDEGRLADLVPSLPVVGDELADTAFIRWLQTDPNDSEWDGRLKDAVEGIGLAFLAEPVLLGLSRAFKKNLNPATDPQAFKQTLEEVGVSDAEIRELGLDLDSPEFSTAGPERSRFAQEALAAGRSQGEIDAVLALSDRVAMRGVLNNPGTTVDDFYKPLSVVREVAEQEREFAFGSDGQYTLFQGPTLEDLFESSDPAAVLGLNTKKDGTIKATDRERADAINLFSENRGDTIPEGDYSRAATVRTAKLMVQDWAYSVKKFGTEGGNWYSEGPPRTMALLAKNLGWDELRTDRTAQQAFLFHVALASDGAEVKPNLAKAMKGYEQFRQTGVLSPEKIGLASGENKVIADTANRMMKEMGQDKFFEFLETPFTVRELEDLYGIAVTGESPDALVIGAMTFGPKLGAFYGNLSGHSGFLTMDRWWTKTWNRLRGTLAPSKEKTKRLEDKYVAEFESVLGLDMKREKGKKDKHDWRELDPRTTEELFADLGLDFERAKTDREYLLRTAAPVIKAQFAKGHWFGEYELKPDGTVDTWKSGDRAGEPKKKYAGFAVKRPINKWANKVMKLYGSEAINLSPRGPHERRAMKTATAIAVDIIRQTYDPTMTVSKFQAQLWFREKDLYKLLGAPKRAWYKQDYTSAVHELLQERLGKQFNPDVEDVFNEILDARSNGVGRNAEQPQPATPSRSDLEGPAEAGRLLPREDAKFDDAVFDRYFARSDPRAERGRLIETENDEFGLADEFDGDGRDFDGDIVDDADSVARSLEQRNRGQIDFLRDGRAVIRLFESADGSTLIHELGHYYRRGLRNTDPELAKKFDEWAGVKEGEDWSVEQEERFARGLENYLSSGKAPTPELEGAFKTLRTLIADAYRNIRSLILDGRIKAKPETQALFDELFVLPQPGQRRKLTPYEQRRAAAGEVPTNGSFAVVTDAGRDRFREGVQRTHREHKYGKAVAVKDDAFYADRSTRLFMSEDGTAGVAVTPDGDIVSVYKEPGSTADINPLLAEAGVFAKTLDGFDINGKLPGLYAQHGFRPAARVKFDPNYAPEGWDVDVYGTPDVVLMVKDLDGGSGLPEIGDDVAETIARVPLFESWDDAAAHRNAALMKAEAARRENLAKPNTPSSTAEEITKTLYQAQTRLGVAGLDKFRFAAATHTNVAKMQTTQEVHELLTAFDSATQPLIDAEIGDKQTLAEVLAEATERGLDGDKVAADLRKGALQAQNIRLPSLIVSGRMLKVAVAEKVVQAADKVLKAAPGADQDLLLAMSALAKVDTHLGILTKELARATGSGRIAIPGLSEDQAKAVIKALGSLSPMDKGLLDAADKAAARGDTALAGYLRSKTNGQNALKVARMVKQAHAVGQVGKQVRKLRELDDPSLIDAFLEVYKASLLSGLRTFSINALSGGLQTYMQATARILGAGARMGTPGGRKDFKSSLRFMVQLHGAMFDVAGMLVMNQALTKGYTPDIRANVRRTVNQETPAIFGDLDVTGKTVSATESKKAIQAKTFGLEDETAAGKTINGVGRLIRLPFLVSMLGEEWWSTINYLAFVRNKALDSQAVADILEDVSLTPAQKQVAVQDFVESYTRQAFDDFGSAARESNKEFKHTDAARYAKSANFMQDLEYGLGQFLLDGKRETKYNIGPLMEVVLPFVKAPTNLIRTAARYSIAGEGVLALGRSKARPKLAQWEADKNRGEMILGGMLMTFAAFLAGNGMITGGGPVNADERELLMQSGWRPYSFVRYGADGKKEYIQFSRADPQASVLGLVADMVEVLPYLNPEEKDQAVAKALIGVAQNFSSKTYLRGTTEVFQAILRPERHGQKYLTNLGANMVPFSSLGRGINATIDDNMRETYTFLDAVKLRIPGMSKDLPPRRNLFGEPITPLGGYIPFTSGETAVGKMASPIAFSRESDDDAITEMARLQVGFSMPGKTLDNVDMTVYRTRDGQNAYDRYLELAGTLRLNGRTQSQAVNALIDSAMYRRLPEPTGDPKQDAYNPRVKAIKSVMDGYRDAARQKLLQEVPELREEIRRRKLGGMTGNRRPGPSNSLDVIDRLLQ